MAGNPKYYLLEVIDDSYKNEDPTFPFAIRVNRKDIEKIFPLSKISSWETYKFPVNEKTKKLYLIEK
jgi:protein-L-isoaspartate(D-aspartate) O-methyltransferase